MMRRHKIKTVAEASLVTNEDEARAVNNQVVFQKGLKTSTTSSLQEHFNSHFGKVASHYFILYTLECLMSIPYCPASAEIVTQGSVKLFAGWLVSTQPMPMLPGLTLTRTDPWSWLHQAPGH